MEELAEILHRSVLFSGLSGETIEQEILPCGRIQEVPRGGHLIRPQERCDSFGIVLKGKVKLMHFFSNGDYGIMGVLEEGDLFGVDLIGTGSRISPYCAEAMQPAQVISFPASAVLEPGTLEEGTRIEILRKMMNWIADENMRKEYRLAILFQKGIRDRIMTYLTMQAQKRHSASFTIPFNRDELASYLCVNRTCLSHELSLMAQEGILECHRGTFTLLNDHPGSGEI